MQMPQTDPFRKIADAAYSRYVPIIPHDAVLSPLSSLSQRTGSSDPRGKAPGLLLDDGKWGSYDWLRHVLSSTTLQTLAAAGAGVGVIAGDQGDGTSLFFIDADTLDEDLARRILDIFVEVFGFTPDVRIGRAPKFLMPVRCHASMPYMRVEFAGKDGKPERVEMLSDGRQAVFLGIHPYTGQPYIWLRGLPHYHEIPIVEAEDILRFFGRLRRELPEASKLITEGATNIPPQESLKAPLDIVRRAVAQLPNTTDAFPSREDYLHVGYAIKAALPDHPDEALELYLQWCGRWQDPSGRANDPAVAERDWKRMKPPFKVGAPWLFDQLDRITGSGAGSQLAVEAVFQPIEPEPGNPFALAPPAPSRAIKVLTRDQIRAMRPPRFLVRRYLPENSLSFLYAVPGVGKSFFALDIALHIAYGLPTWHGDRIRSRPGAAVVYLAYEGASGYQARIEGWECKHPTPIDGPCRFGLVSTTINFTKGEDIQALIDAVRAAGFDTIDLIVVDTVSRSLPGVDENLQKDMTLFVRACDALRETFHCAVMGIHHANAQGEMRGSSVLLGAGDAVFKVERRKKDGVVALTCVKQKDAPDQWTDLYTMDVVALAPAVDEDGEVEERSTWVPRRIVTGSPDGRRGGVAGEVADAVKEAIRVAWKDGRPWGRGYQAGARWAVTRLVKDFGMQRGQAEELLEALEAAGEIEVALLDQRSKTKGYRTIEPVDNLSNEGIFG